MEKNKKTVIVFGVFDLLHEGHVYFLKQAKKLGDKLVVIVAQDDNVIMLKNKKPKHSLSERINNMRHLGIADQVIKGDTRLNSWNAILRIRPKIIALGYDQSTLEKALEQNRKNFPFDFEIRQLDAHKSRVFHTRFLK